MINSCFTQNNMHPHVAIKNTFSFIVNNKDELVSWKTTCHPILQYVLQGTGEEKPIQGLPSLPPSTSPPLSATAPKLRMGRRALCLWWVENTCISKPPPRTHCLKSAATSFAVETTALLWGNATMLDQNHQILEAESRGVAEQEMKVTYNKCWSRSVLFGHIILFINHAHKYMHCLPRTT